MKQLETLRPTRPLLLELLIATFSILPFAGAIFAGFIYDDHLLVAGNELVRGGQFAKLWSTEFFHNARALHFQYFRPLVTSSWALDWALWEGHPGGFHATNLLLHGAITCLVFTTLRRWSGRETLSLLAALLWAWHPTKVEAVVWISGRTDLLSALGLLIAAFGASRRFRGLRLGLPIEVLGIALAFCSKENAVTLPGLIAVEAWVAKGRPALDTRSIGRAILSSLPHGGFVALYLALRALLLPIEPQEFAHEQRFFTSLLLGIETWGEAAKALAFPWPLTMHRAPVYIDEAKRFLHDPVRLTLGTFVIGGLFASIALLGRKRPLALVGLLLFAFLLLPTANIRPTRMPVLFAERFLYLPSLGLALFIVGIAPREAAPSRRLGLGMGSAAALFALFLSATASALHTENLHDDESFWAHELRVHPNLPSAVRPAVQKALGERRYAEALELSGRGYRGAKAWTVGHPFDIELALYGAEAWEGMVLDKDREALEKLAQFFRAFFIERGLAELQAKEELFAIHGGRRPAAWLREMAPHRFAEFQAVAARALVRSGDCEAALVLTREARGELEIPSAQTTLALAFARCGAWEEALELARELPEGPPRDELVANLASSERMLDELGAAHDIDAALARAKIHALLLDRGGAIAALSGHEDELISHPQGALYLARTAFAAGEDDLATRALSRWMSAEEGEEVLAGWARELGRE